MHEIAIGLVFLVFAIAFLWDDFYGMLLLLCGFLLANRSFAYLHLQIGPVPLYITEFSLMLWSLKVIDRLRIRTRPLFVPIPKSILLGLLLFWGVGMISFIRGALNFPLLNVVRDSAMVYYSFAAILVCLTPMNRERLDLLLHIGGLVLFIHAFRVISPIVPAVLRSNSIYGQGAGSSLCLSIGLLSILAIHNLDVLDWRRLTFAVIVFTAVLTELVRTAWTGLAAGSCVLFLAMLRKEGFVTVIRRGMLDVLLIVGGALFILSLTPKIKAWYHSLAQGTKTQRTIIITSKAEPAITPTAPAPQVTAPVASPVASPVAVPVPVPAPAPVKSVLSRSRIPSVLEELDTFKDIGESPNVVTRLRMWQDALEEIFSVGLFSNNLHHDDLQRYRLPSRALHSTAQDIVIEVAGMGFETQPVVLHVVPKDQEVRRTPREHIARIMKIAIGIPFGKLYLPPQIVNWLNSPNRYDPHNSWIAIFYRLGLAGLAVFVFMQASFLTWILKRFKMTLQDNPWINSRLLMILVGMVYIYVHMLTDNTLENPFKGMFLWMLMGLAFNPVLSETPDRCRL